ncbi:MAG: sensor of ECF-type sigma factor [Flavobacteriaceae bacterium]|nr:sensor of ECF-type sigma factor [Flavobacteriaceae bacterium]
MNKTLVPMKKIILTTIILMSFSNLFAQKFEKVKALKTAFITDRLDLSSDEAEKFWPVYNQYEKELHQLQVVERMAILDQIAEKGGVSKMTEKESSDLLQKILDLNEKINLKEKNKYLALKKVISSQKILKLIKVEESFKRELFKLLQEQRNKKD